MYGVGINIDLIKAIFSATFWSSLFLAYLLFRRREAAGAKFLSLIMLFSAIWTGGSLLGLLVHTEQLKEFALALSYIAVTMIPSIMLAFVLDYSGLRRFLKWKYFITLQIFPLIILIIGFIPDLNFLLWNVNVDDHNFVVTNINYGPLFWPMFFYCYGILGISIIILFRALKIFTSYFKRHTIIFLVASFCPIIFNLIHVFNLDNLGITDLTPVGFTISISIIFIGIYNFKVFDLLPVARETIIETIGDVVLVVDNNYRIVMHNKSFTNLSLCNQNRIIGKALQEINPQIFEFLKSNHTAGITKSTEFISDGKTYDVNINHLEKMNGLVAGSILVMRDITERKTAEKRIKESYQHLNEQLEINDALISDLKSFSHSVAHNLKSPLNGLVGLSELLTTEFQLNKTQYQWAETILSTGLKMSDIIDSLLFFSSISVKEVQSDRLEIDKILAEALKRNKVEIDKRKAVIHAPESWPMVVGYSDWLEEVWVNLISNALKYGGNPPVLSLGFEIIDVNFVRFYVQDNGSGLSSEQIELLFTPFQNFNNSNYDSHGLGLSIVKRIVNKLQGEVLAESENIPGKGCRFSFTLPRWFL